MGCVGPSVVVGLTTVGILVSGAGPSLVGCQALPCVVAAGPLVHMSQTRHSWLLILEHPGAFVTMWIGGASS